MSEAAESSSGDDDFDDANATQERRRLQLNEIWFQQVIDEITTITARLTLNSFEDGAAIHIEKKVMAFLRLKFGSRIISRNAEIGWPPYSPDLSCLDTFYWSYVEKRMKELFRVTKFDSIAKMVSAVEDATSTVPEELIRKAMFHCFRTRPQYVIRENGGHFEHLMKSKKHQNEPDS